jgi:NTE family protein
MEEAGVPIDIMAGTSMGGIVAGLYAAGVPLQELIAFGRNTGIIDIASPDRKWRGMFGHRKMAKLLADLLGGENVTFEDLRIPTAVIATDVEKGELVILNQGPLIPALLATSAVPILFSPVHHQGRWLIDGGVLNNFPIDVVRQMGADPVVGVAVPASIDLYLDDEQEERGLSLRGLRIFSNHTRDWKQPFLIAEASMSIAMESLNRNRLMRYPPDLLLKIRLPNVGILTSDDNEAIIEAGRKVAMEHLAELVELRVEHMPPFWKRYLESGMYRLRRAWKSLRGPQYHPYPDRSSQAAIESS